MDPVDGTAGLRSGRGYVTGLCLVDAGGAAVAAMGNGAADERACVMVAVRCGACARGSCASHISHAVP